MMIYFTLLTWSVPTSWYLEIEILHGNWNLVHRTSFENPNPNSPTSDPRTQTLTQPEPS